MKKNTLIITIFLALSPFAYAMEEESSEDECSSESVESSQESSEGPLSIQDLLDRGDLEEELQKLALEGELELDNNGLTSLEGLENIPNPELVRRLDLSGNHIPFIPHHAFDRFINLEVLDLTDNPLIQVQEDLVAQLRNLKELHLEDTDIVEVPAHFLDNNPNLEVLHLFDNKLESLPHGLLDKLTELEEFDASRNKLTVLHADLFRNQWKKLKTIDLSGNRLESLSRGLLDPVTELENLDLSYNKLTVLDQNLLQNQLKLKELWLGANQLTQIPNITHLVQLKELGAMNNKELKLSPSTIKFILAQKISCNVPALLEDIPPYSLSQLIADLGENWRDQLLVVDENGLITLDLSNRGLTDLEFHDPVEFTDVQIIKANNNFITAIPADFFRVYIPEYNGTLARFPNAWEIDLSSNLIQALPVIRLDPDLPVLDNFNLHNNRIKTIGGFKGTRNHLRTLDLGHNQIREISENALNALHELHYLLLENNQLTVLPRNTFKNLPALEKLILRHNKLGNKDQYVFPPKAKVKFYPQEIPHLKMLAAKKVAQNMERMNLLEVIKTLRAAPADMHDAILQAASKSVALKIRSALIVEELSERLLLFDESLHLISESLDSITKLTQQSPSESSFAALRRMVLAHETVRKRINETILKIQTQSKDAQQALLILASEELREILIQAGIGENIPGEIQISHITPELAELANSFEGKNTLQTIKMLASIEPAKQRELAQVAPRNIRKKIKEAYRAALTLDNFQKYPVSRLGFMPAFNKLAQESQLAVFELAPEDVKEFLIEQGFNPQQPPAKEKEEAFEEFVSGTEPFEFEFEEVE